MHYPAKKRARASDGHQLGLAKNLARGGRGVCHGERGDGHGLPRRADHAHAVAGGGARDDVGGVCAAQLYDAHRCARAGLQTRDCCVRQLR